MGFTDGHLRELGKTGVFVPHVFLTEVRFNTRLVELRKEVFGDDYPASTLVTVAALNRPEMMVEIQATAVVDE